MHFGSIKVRILHSNTFNSKSLGDLNDANRITGMFIVYNQALIQFTRILNHVQLNVYYINCQIEMR